MTRALWWGGRGGGNTTHGTISSRANFGGRANQPLEEHPVRAVLVPQGCTSPLSITCDTCDHKNAQLPHAAHPASSDGDLFTANDRSSIFGTPDGHCSIKLSVVQRNAFVIPMLATADTKKC